LRPQATDPNTGAYSFVVSVSGTYTIKELPKLGWTPTFAPAPFVVNGGSVAGGITGKNFGNFQNTTISGVKLDDKNGNGIQDPGEPFLAGFVFQARKTSNFGSSTW